MRWLAAIAAMFSCLAAIPVYAENSSQSTALPPYVPAYEPTSVDERGLWMETDEDERALRDSALLIRDEKLTAYIKSVLCGVVGQDRCRNVRVYVLEVPVFNASMMPNGAMRVYSGLLLRVQNEAELASVLGHEFAHFELRHGLMAFKQRRSSSDVAAWIGVLGGVAGTNVGTLQVSVLGTQFSFSRAQETQADLLSLKYIGQSPYPPTAAASVWKYMMGEADARAVARGRKGDHHYAAGFFDTHPTDLARESYLAEAAAKMEQRGDLREKQYREAIRPYLGRFLAAQVKLNDFGGTEFLLESMSHVEGWTGELLFARGELHRQRANPRDLETASDLFRQAIAQGYTDPLVHRELGLSLLRSGATGEGQASLQQYLKLQPNASDAGIIKTLAGN